MQGGPVQPILPADRRVERQRADVIQRFLRDPWLAHSYIFAHRHTEESCEAHKACVADIWSGDARRNIEAFRGFGKSTLLEETLILKAAMRMFHNILIVGAAEARAIERLAAIKHEILTNETLEATFGQLKSEPWQETRIVLSNGVCIQALGRDQSILGLKYLDWRPDAVLIDDVEPADETRSEAEKLKTWNWFTRALVPSLDSPVNSWIRVLGTRRGALSLSERLETAGWPTSKYPIETVGERGERAATWEAKFPLSKVDDLRAMYRGDLHAYEQEFMCRASSDAARLFKREELRYEQRGRTFEPVWVMYDPARTKGQTSATTGKAVWSWVGNKLLVWECAGHMWTPDEIIDDVIATARKYGPVSVAIEKTGLNDWLMQPLRHAMLREGILLPLVGVEAPRGKLDFIAALQPLITAGELILMGEPSDFASFAEQVHSFPRGRIDAPNALAYARTLRAGQPQYPDFGQRHVDVDSRALDDLPLFLGCNSDGQVVAAQLVQRRGRGLVVLADHLAEGLPGEVVAELAAEVALLHQATTRHTARHYQGGDDLYKLPQSLETVAPTQANWVIPPDHFQAWNNHGLEQAIRRIPARVSMGKPPADGRAAVSRALREESMGVPRLMVSSEATWTLRAMSGGYVRGVGGSGLPNERAQPGIYRVLMEGLESLVGSLLVGASADSGEGAPGIAGDAPSPQPIAYTRGGVAYKSAIPEHHRRT